MLIAANFALMDASSAPLTARTLVALSRNEMPSPRARYLSAVTDATAGILPASAVATVAPSSAALSAFWTAIAMPVPAREAKSCFMREASTPWSRFVPEMSKPCR